MNLVKKLALSLAIILPLSIAPILTSCNSEDNTVVSAENLNNAMENINNSISADSNKKLECVGFSFQSYNSSTVLNIYAQEYYAPIYSYKITPNSVEEILIQPASYKYYTVTYILEGVDPVTLEVPLDTVFPISDLLTGDLNDNKIKSLNTINKTLKDGKLQSIIEDETDLNNVQTYN